MKVLRVIFIAIAATMVASCSDEGNSLNAAGPTRNVAAAFRSAAVPAPSHSFTTIHRFANESSGGGNPFSDVLYANGVFYGATVGFGGPDLLNSTECGSIYVLTPNQNFTSFTVKFLHLFDRTDGCNPLGHLIVIGSRLYGATENGGAFGGGTVFSIGTAGGPLTDLYSFKCGSDGCNPEGPLISLDGNVYGTTYGGGTGCGDGCGTVFSVPVTGGSDVILHSFTGSPDGAAPTGGVKIVGSTLYGTTTSGGKGNFGSVFGVPLNGGPETMMYSFVGGPSDGANPDSYGRLTNIGSNLYGTTTAGGTSGNGTVFSLPITGGPDTLLYSFAGGSDGAAPEAPVLPIGTTLYGTTNRDGVYGVGTLYSVPLAGGADTVIHQFELADHQGGYGRNSGLTDVNNELYGTTQVSGDRNIYGYGTIYQQLIPQ